MRTRTAKLAAIAAVTIAAALLATPWVIAATTTSAVPGASGAQASYGHTDSTNQTFRSQGPGPGPEQARPFPGAGVGPGFGQRSEANLAVGQTIAFSSTEGRYTVVGASGTNGTASGSITFTVTSKSSQGFALSISAGTITVGGTTYTITSGAAQTGRAADVVVGQGATTPAGQFLLRGTASGSFAGTSGTILLDFSAGTTEYAVALSGTVTG